jgi:hypothetical protein
MIHNWIKTKAQKREDFMGPVPKRLVWKCTNCGAQLHRSLKVMDSIPPSEATLVTHERDVTFGTFATPIALNCEEAIAYKVMES